MTDTLLPFFQVFDHFSMAVAATETSSNIQSLMAGLKMIGSEFDRAFSDLGIERIDATGKDFDPATQEAMSQEASDTVPAGKVIRQWSYGYKLGDHLLKAANVVVSSGPAEKKEEAESGAQE
jgi:molecular chaperone GrpE